MDIFADLGNCAVPLDYRVWFWSHNRPMLALLMDLKRTLKAEFMTYKKIYDLNHQKYHAVWLQSAKSKKNFFKISGSCMLTQFSQLI